MKTKQFLLGIMAGLLLCTGCKKEDPTWLIQEKNISVCATCEYVYIQVYQTLASWESEFTAIVSGADWCTVDDITYAYGIITICLGVENNLTAEPRTAQVTVNAVGQSETVIITQEAGAPVVSIVDNTMRELDYTAGTYSVSVISNNASWTATVDPAATWCTLTTASGKGDGAIIISTQEAIYKRHTTVFVSAGTSKDAVILFQHGMPVQDQGANIGGVIWATRNVNDFGTFAGHGEAGKFYQFNRAVAYTSTDPLSPAWDNTYSDNGDWSLINDPCPEGWRVPSVAEFESLAASGWRWVTADESGHGIPGTWLGPGAQTASWYPTVPDDAIFLPAASARIIPDGHLLTDDEQMYQWAGVNGCYWPREQWGGFAHPMQFGSQGVISKYGVSWNGLCALSVRCVKRNN